MIGNVGSNASLGSLQCAYTTFVSRQFIPIIVATSLFFYVSTCSLDVDVPVFLNFFFFSFHYALLKVGGGI